MNSYDDGFNKGGALLIERGFATKTTMTDEYSTANLTPKGEELFSLIHDLFDVPPRKPESVVPQDVLDAIGFLLFVKPTQ